MQLLKRHHFLNTLYRTAKISDTYKSLHYQFNDSCFYKNHKEKTNQKALFEFVYCFPKYLKPKLSNKESRYFNVNLPSAGFKSFGIIISDDINSVDDYIKRKFSKNLRYVVNKNKKRLEKCFNINYKVYYGTIKRDDYEFLMSETKKMLESRFQQKNEPNYYLDNWEIYYDFLYPLINKKNASIFVIYNEKKPIQITVNLHHNKICFWHIPIYNIDYAKFGLGHTGLIKQLEWCLNNNYEFLDMGIGEFEYKNKWSNYSFDLETHIICHKKSPVNNLIAKALTNIFKYKYYFESVLIKRSKKKLKNKKRESNIPNKISVLEVTDDINISNLEVLSIDKLDNYKNLRKSVNDFLYLKQVHIDSIIVYKKNKDTFFIKTKD